MPLQALSGTTFFEF